MSTMNSMDSEQSRCGAKTRSGKPCSNPPTQGRTRCRMHGGSPAQPRGANHWNFKHGAYSKALQDLPHTREAYERALQNRYLASMTDELALAHARLEDLLSAGDWDAAQVWLDLIRKLASAKTKYDVLAQRYVSYENFEAIFAGLRNAIDTHVTNPDIVQAIIDDILKLLDTFED